MRWTCSAANMGGGLHYWGGGYSYNPKLTNCVIWDNAAPAGPEISILDNSSGLTVRYCDVRGGPAGVYVSNSHLTWGAGNIDTDPLFADAANGDYHLTGASPCIDAGYPTSDYSLEPQPNGGRINMGAYGNTAEAETKGWLYIQDYVQVRSTRVGRAVFEYEFAVNLRNASNQTVTDVTVELLRAPGNVQVIDPVVQVGTVPAGETVISQDTFTIRVDRATLVSPLPIGWQVSYTGGVGSFGTLLELNEPVVADFDGNGHVDSDDLEHFMGCASGAGIPQEEAACFAADLDSDGDVDMVDFGIFQRCFAGPDEPPACP